MLALVVLMKRVGDGRTGVAVSEVSADGVGHQCGMMVICIN